jgi:hypothetical protein
MSNFSVELIMSEFGTERQNAGGASFNYQNRLNPTMESFLQQFPEATVKVYTDQQINFGAGVHTVLVQPPFDKSSGRYGWRAHNYYQAVGMLSSKADYAIAMDSDMLIISDGFKVITEFAKIFGIALPINPRLLIKIDGGIGIDSRYKMSTDRTKGLGLTFNVTPIIFNTKNKGARAFLEKYCSLFLESPGRSAPHYVEASFQLGFQPYILPPQWCVCSPRDLDSKHIWPEAIILHVGHTDVLPRWRREAFKSKIRSSIAKLRKYVKFGLHP